MDLSKISAKSVRKNMLAANDTLDPSWVKQNKQGIDELIAQIFNTVNASQQSQPSVPPSPSASSSQHKNKRKREDEEGNGIGNGNPLPPSQMPISSVTNNHKQRPSSIQKAHQQQLSDLELARQLSAELNPSGRATRGSGTGNRKSASGAGGGGGGSKGGRGSAKKVKSNAKIIDDSDNEGGGRGSDMDEDDSYNSSEDAPKKRHKKSGGGGGTSEGGGRAKGGFAKEFVLSEPLAALTGEATLSRPQVVKALWKHIKENQLQNPKDGRVILCDDKVCRLHY